MEKILNFIGGEFREPRSGRFVDNVDPSRGKPYSLLADSDAADVEAAVAAAREAFPAWSRTPAGKRAQILNRMADLIQERFAEFVRAESRDNGKPVSVAAEVDIPRSQTNLRYFASAIVQFHGESFQTDTRAINYTEYSPLGVVACISPWNLPLYLLTWKVAPALAAGNTVVAKPSEVTPMTAFLLCQVAKDAGLPPGVLNMVHGTGPNVGTPLTSHPDVKAVSFTGSTATGRRIAEVTAGRFTRVSLEMGGKNANIVFADAPFEKALETTVRSSFANQGQICLCGSRIFVERPIYEKFRDALAAKARALRHGDPLDENTQQGALVSAAHYEKVLGHLRGAIERGGKVVCGGERPKLAGELAGGYFLQPTLIEGLPASDVANQEEIFGPVATLIPFDREDEVIAMANGTRYGLAASVWTSDLQKAHRVARSLESGLVWLNTWMLRDLRTPFGGVKESGVGREGGMEALRFFSEVKNVCLAME